MSVQDGPSGAENQGAEGDEIIEVVRDTVQQLELLTERLKTFMDDMEAPSD